MVVQRGTVRSVSIFLGSNAILFAEEGTGRGAEVKRVRILIADDHKAMRDKVVKQLENDFEVVGAVGDGNAVLEAEARMLPEVCVLDISMPKLSGIEAAGELKKRGSRCKVVFVTVHQDPDFLEAALDKGALGYVLKSRMALDLMPAINAAVAGRLFISPTCDFPDTISNDEQQLTS